MNLKKISVALLMLLFIASISSCTKESENDEAWLLALFGVSSCEFANADAANYVWPAAPQTPRIQFVAMLSDKCAVQNGQQTANTEERNLSWPKGVASDGNGKVYVSDRGGVASYDLNTGKVGHFGVLAENGVWAARGIAVAADGRVFIADYGRKAVMVFNSDNTFLTKIGVGDFLNPSGVAIDNANGRLYVVDAAKSTLNAYTLDGAPVFTVSNTPENQLKIPTQVAVNSLGNVYVLHQGTLKVNVYDSSGNYLLSFGESGRAPGNFIRPKGIAIDSEDNVYVTDVAFDNFQIFNAAGQIRMYVGNAGVNPGQFSLPSLIYIDGNDRIYVAEFTNHRVQVFQYLGAKYYEGL
jgi:DNA-binding beta-propeller fold protein YncE